MWWRRLSGWYFVTSRSKTANFPINAFSTWIRSFVPTADLTVVKFPLRALFHRHLPRLSGTFCTAWSVYRIFVMHAWSSWKPFQMTLIVRPSDWSLQLYKCLANLWILPIRSALCWHNCAHELIFSFTINHHGHTWQDTLRCHIESLHSVGVSASRCCRSIPGYVLCICCRTFSEFNTSPVDSGSHIIHLQAYSWDWLMSIPEEYTAIRKVGFSPPNIAYFVSRSVCMKIIPSVAYRSCQRVDLELLVFVSHAPPSKVFLPYILRSSNWNGVIVGLIGNCAALKYVEGIFFEIAVPATSLLFFFRVKAVYNHSRIVTSFFGSLWLAIAGLSILIMLGITGGEYLGYRFYSNTRWQSSSRSNTIHAAL